MNAFCPGKECTRVRKSLWNEKDHDYLNSNDYLQYLWYWHCSLTIPSIYLFCLNNYIPMVSKTIITGNSSSRWSSLHGWDLKINVCRDSIYTAFINWCTLKLSLLDSTWYCYWINVQNDCHYEMALNAYKIIMGKIWTSLLWLNQQGLWILLFHWPRCLRRLVVAAHHTVSV